MSGARNAGGRTLPQLLERHRDRLSACRRCEGLHEAVLPVLSSASEPRVMLVGQAPGKTELSDQKPFAGRAGKTLFKWLARAGVDEATFRERVYIAAVTRCYPGPSPSGRGDRVPSPLERERCGVWLEEELRIIRPETLILVGKLAIERFLPPAPLDALVGRAHVVQHEGGSSLAVPLPHPSGASSWIHAPGHMALLEQALEILGRELGRLGVGSGPESGGRGAPRARSAA